MTDRAEKLTRLPIRLPRMRPSLPFSRSVSDLVGAPERCVDCFWPRTLLFISANTSDCSFEILSRKSGVAWSYLSTRWLLMKAASSIERLLMSCNLCVMSSCPRIRLPSDAMIAGRAMGGGTSSVSFTMLRGCATVGLSPSVTQSSSRMCRRILAASMLVKGFPSHACRSSSFSQSSGATDHSTRIVPPGMRTYEGCGPLQ